MSADLLVRYLSHFHEEADLTCITEQQLHLEKQVSLDIRTRFAEKAIDNQIWQYKRILFLIELSILNEEKRFEVC